MANKMLNVEHRLKKNLNYLFISLQLTGERCDFVTKYLSTNKIKKCFIVQIINVNQQLVPQTLEFSHE